MRLNTNTMTRHNTIALAGFLMFGTNQPVRAQAGDIQSLRRQLEEQRAVNRKLIERLDALEAAQEDLLKTVEAVKGSVQENVAFGEERAELLDEIQEEYFDLQDSFDALPRLSGYYDFEYFNDDRDDSPGEFRQHHLSVHLSQEWDHWRLFSEFEFEFGTLIEGDGGPDLENTRGEVKVEQAWGEYVRSDLFTVRGGLILIPTYWNVNHYPNVVLSTRRPLMVRKVFRESFVGAMAYGDKYWGDFGIGYHAYLGNGRSVFFTKNDDNEGKAVGAKLTLHLPSNDELDVFDVGFSVYHESPRHDDRVLTWGVESKLCKGPWEFLAEVAKSDASIDRTGFYLQPSYRFNEKWAAFYRYDILSVEHSGETQENTLGLNFRPIPDVSLKLEYFHSRRSTDQDSSGVATSIAIKF